MLVAGVRFEFSFGVLVGLIFPYSPSLSLFAFSFSLVGEAGGDADLLHKCLRFCICLLCLSIVRLFEMLTLSSCQLCGLCPSPNRY